MTKKRASIDIGTYTARLLIAGESDGRLMPIARKRAYIRLGEGFGDAKKKSLQPEAIRRTLEALKDFSRAIEDSRAGEVLAVTTGVVREAENRDEFLRVIREHTGIRVRVITGETEAALSARGVIEALGLQPGPLLVFDLGGGSTEFFFKGDKKPLIRSIPLGAMILTRAHLKSDPPDDGQVRALSSHIDEILEEGLPEFRSVDQNCFIAGTGGTVTTLAATRYGIRVRDICPEKLNGLTLTGEEMEAQFDGLRKMRLEERRKLPGLDPKRAEVIVAGSLAVIKTLRFFKSRTLSVSLSDLLEGLLIDSFKGEKNG